MPSVPLYYQPLVRAEIDAAAIGKSSVGEARERQVNFAFIPQPGAETLIQPLTEAARKVVNAQDSPVPQALAKFLTGIENLQKSLPGSNMLGGIQLAGDKDGWIANRVTTMFEQDQSALDTASPADAARMAAGLITKLDAEFDASKGGGDLELMGNVLSVAPSTSTFLGKFLTAPATVTAPEAADFSAKLNREMQRAVTPPGGGSGAVAWMEDGTSKLLAVWPGAIEATAKLLGFQVDAAQLAEAAKVTRAELVGNPANQGVQSLSKLLQAAGIDINTSESSTAAFDLLQRAPVEAVPGSIAQALIGYNQLDPTKLDMIAGRIVESGGSPGNIAGLIAELPLFKPAPPIPTPPTDPLPPE